MAYHQHKIDLTNTQLIQVKDTFEACNKMFFYLEDLRLKVYKENHYMMTVNELRNILAQEKRSSFFLRKVDARALIRVVNDLPNVPKKLPPSKKIRFMKKRTKRSNVKYSTSVAKTGITIYTTFVNIPKLGEVKILEPLTKPIRVKIIEVFYYDGDYFIGYDTNDAYANVEFIDKAPKILNLTKDSLLKRFSAFSKCKDCPTDAQRHLTVVEEYVNSVLDTNKEIYLEPLDFDTDKNLTTHTYLQEFYALLQMYASAKRVKITFVKT